MVFDPNFILTGIDGIELEGIEREVHAGKILAHALYHSPSANQLKYHDWALKLWNRMPIEINDTERLELIEFIKGTRLPPVTAAPLIAMLTVNE